MSTQPQPPSPPGVLDMSSLLSGLYAAQAQLQGAQGQNAAVVPLWVVRPPSVPNAGSTYDDDILHGSGQRARRGGRVPTPGDFAAIGQLVGNDPYAGTPQTVEFAASYWMDMPDEDKVEFAKRAEKAGLWDPRDGFGALVRAWSNAVNSAAEYNAARPEDQGKWISPFEAMEKLYGANVASMGGTVNGFTGWRTERSKQVARFTSDQIAQTAKQVLQRELGRDPTDAEVAAYTIAANNAAKANPQTVTTKTRDLTFDAQGRPVDSETVRSVSGDVPDPAELIEEEVEGTEEHGEVQAATVYLPALMQALGL